MLLLLAFLSVPAAQGQTYLFDFGGGSGMEEGEDELNYWNNVTGGVADNSTGRLDDILDTTSQESPIDLVMIARFNGVNENGTQNGTDEEQEFPAPFPVDATRDSWFGNTENFGAGTDFFPSFKLSELDPGTGYTLTFYASRTGVGDNRETQYTVTGATEATAFLNVANNIDQVATVTAMKPDAAGEITILLEPGPNNNNGNHFTYLGVLKLEAGGVVVPDTTPPELVSTESAGPWRVSLTFSEPLGAAAVLETDRYSINDGAVLVNAAEVNNGGKTVHLFPSEALSGNVTVKINGLTDRAGNAFAANTTGTALIPPGPDGKSLLFDFGAGNTGTENAAVSDDPLNIWNNVSDGFAAVDGNSMTDLLTNDGTVQTGWSLEIVSRFNGANAEGSRQSPLYPEDATRDTLYGNTEVWSNLENITPVFKLTGLTPSVPLDFSFFATRVLGTPENRETVYTVSGSTTKTAALDPVNNTENTAEVAGVLPTAEGEITISLTPGPNNENANHFTYLGVMKVTPQAANPGGEVTILSPVLQNGKIIVNWTGTGALEWSTTLTGQWTPVTPAPAAPYSEDIAPGQKKFFRVRK